MIALDIPPQFLTRLVEDLATTLAYERRIVELMNADNEDAWWTSQPQPYHDEDLLQHMAAISAVERAHKLLTNAYARATRPQQPMATAEDPTPPPPTTQPPAESESEGEE